MKKIKLGECELCDLIRTLIRNKESVRYIHCGYRYSVPFSVYNGHLVIGDGVAVCETASKLKGCYYILLRDQPKAPIKAPCEIFMYYGGEHGSIDIEFKGGTLHFDICKRYNTPDELNSPVIFSADPKELFWTPCVSHKYATTVTPCKSSVKIEIVIDDQTLITREIPSDVKGNTPVVIDNDDMIKFIEVFKGDKVDIHANYASDSKNKLKFTSNGASITSGALSYGLEPAFSVSGADLKGAFKQLSAFMYDGDVVRFKLDEDSITLTRYDKAGKDGPFWNTPMARVRIQSHVDLSGISFCIGTKILKGLLEKSETSFFVPSAQHPYPGYVVIPGLVKGASAFIMTQDVNWPQEDAF